MPASPAPRAGGPGPYLGAALAWLLDVALLAAALDGPAALLRHERALALLATWAAGGLALAWARPPRPRDPAARRADPPLVLATLVLAPLLSPALGALCERLGVLPLPGGPGLRWAGVALAAAGLLLRVVAMRRLGARFSPVLEVQRAHALETGGVYRWMRHPGYAGACVSTLGAVLAFGSAAPLPLVLAMAAATVLRTRREDAMLEAAFGDEYRAWRTRVGALWPRRA